MDLAWLDDFLVLSAQGNFSRAAEARHVTQPAFSRRIRALEQWAGTELFDRSSHRVALTAAGAAFHESAAALVRDLERARSRAREAAYEVAGSVTIASTHMLASSFLPGRLAEAEALLAGASIQLLVDTMSACERLMLAGRVALLLCHHHESAPSSLEDKAFLRVAVGRDRLIAVSVPDEAGRPRHALREEGKTDYLAFRGEAGLARIVDATLLARYCEQLRPVFHSHAALTLITMARAGRGRMFAPESLIAADLHSGALVRAGNESVEIEICLFRRRAKQKAAFEVLWSALLTAEACDRAIPVIAHDT